MSAASLPARVMRRIYREVAQFVRPEARALRTLRRRIGHLPRRQPGSIRVLGWDLAFADAASCISAFDYLVVRRWGDFRCSSQQPRILDCGANIGLSVLHCKRLYPQADITAFEPDPDLCGLLRRNLAVNEVRGVTVVEAALWDEEGVVGFKRDGADEGYVLGTRDDGPAGHRVRAERLVKYLDRPTHLLKMDIEGAEGRVIADCAGALHVVHNVVLEYHTSPGRSQDLHNVLQVLQHAGLRYSVNSLGAWVDLTRPPTDEPSRFEQLFMVYATREWRRS